MNKIIEKFNFSGEISKEELLRVLKKKMDTVHITDIMSFYVHLVKEGKYVQSGYKEEYIEAYVKGFLIRVKEIKDDSNEYNSYVDKEALQNALKNLKTQEEMVEKESSMESNFFRIYEAVSLYTTFIVEEPIHIVGTPFPGGFKVKLEGNTYYCPVKENQKDNPGAVCGFCIAEQDEDVL